MELPPQIERSLEVLKNVGRFVLHRLDGAHGGWSDLPAPANITINEEPSDKLKVVNKRS